MNNIKEFPTRIVRDWAVMQRAISKIAQESGLTDDEAKDVIAQMKPLFDILIVGVSYSIDTTATQTTRVFNDSVSMGLKEVGDKIFAERIKREIFLCLQRG